jgi:tetratricopeptide (TPR) repeat protein
MEQTEPVSVSENRQENTLENTAVINGPACHVRVSPGSYLAALFLLTFFSGFLIYLDFFLWGTIVFCGAWLILPILAWFDRIVFDGKKVYRTGLVPVVWGWFNRQDRQVKVSDIERVETQALRAIRRGGEVFYRYRSQIQGKGTAFVTASGGGGYRSLVHFLFPLLAEDKLDSRSLELRDYLIDPKQINRRTEDLRLPSNEVLENSLTEFHDRTARKKLKSDTEKSVESEIEKAEELRRVANELRLNGNLLQALEAFRRALLLNPTSAWLLFESARCLYSYAGLQRDEKLRHKADAFMRLAERRGSDNADFLSRLGESYLQYADEKRARNVFMRALDLDADNFRSAKGLAELALREGKLAHVVHHFSAAVRAAKNNALKRWAQDEIDYFMRLNNDEDYMEIEIRRINLLEGVQRNKAITMRISLFGFAVIMFGMFTGEQLVSNIGWACTAAAVVIWMGLMIGGKVLADRFPAMEEEDDSD